MLTKPEVAAGLEAGAPTKEGGGPSGGMGCAPSAPRDGAVVPLAEVSPAALERWQRWQRQIAEERKVTKHVPKHVPTPHVSTPGSSAKLATREHDDRLVRNPEAFQLVYPEPIPTEAMQRRHPAFDERFDANNIAPKAAPPRHRSTTSSPPSETAVESQQAPLVAFLQSLAQQFTSKSEAKSESETESQAEEEDGWQPALTRLEAVGAKPCPLPKYGVPKREGAEPPSPVGGAAAAPAKRRSRSRHVQQQRTSSSAPGSRRRDVPMRASTSALSNGDASRRARQHIQIA